jgi:SAM-dependent methyltransferase
MGHDAAAFWDRMARRYARMNLADPAAYEGTLARVLARLARTDRVLEIGCGTGQTAIRLAPSVAAYTAVDISTQMIAIARDRPEGRALPQLDFAVADLGGAPPGPFDAVLAFNLLHLLPDLPTGLAAIRDRMRPGGWLLSKTPCLAELSPLLRLAVPPLQLLGLAPRLTWLRREALEAAIAAAGFEVLETADLPARRAQRYVAARRR